MPCNALEGWGKSRQSWQLLCATSQGHPASLAITVNRGLEPPSLAMLCRLLHLNRVQLPNCPRMLNLPGLTIVVHGIRVETGSCDGVGEVGFYEVRVPHSWAECVSRASLLSLSSAWLAMTLDLSHLPASQNIRTNGTTRTWTANLPSCKPKSIFLPKVLVSNILAQL